MNVHWKGEIMHYRYCLLCMLTGMSFACGAPEPWVTVNSKLSLVPAPIEGYYLSAECGSYQRGKALPEAAAAAQGHFAFFHPDSDAPDLELAEAWDGHQLRVVVRTTSNSPLRAPDARDRTYTFDFLSAGGQDAFQIERAAGGAYEMQVWGAAGEAPWSCQLPNPPS